MMRLLAILSVLAAAVVLVAGCGDDDSGPATAGSNGTDAAFINDMTTHHQGAIDMAELARRHAEHAEIRAMAGDIIRAQRGEIADMSAMRERMRSMHDDDTHGGHMDMDDHAMGMDMDMGALEDARPFDKAFMEEMIDHHEGAIAMARKLLEDGEDPELRRMAQAMIDAQEGEIGQMHEWMRDWYGE